MPPVKGVGDLPYLACHMILGDAFQVNLARKWLWGHSLSRALVQLLCLRLFFFFFWREQGFTLPRPRLTLDSTGREDWPSAGMTHLLGTGLGGLQALCMPGKRWTNTLSIADINHP